MNVTIATSVDIRTAEKLKIKAGEQGISISRLVRDLIEAGLNESAN